MSTYEQVIIRDASAADANAITALHNSIIEEGLLDWSDLKTKERTLEWLHYLDRLQYPCLVCISNDTFIGCASLEPVWEPRADAGAIYSVELHVVVNKDARKDGIATQLFEQLCRHSRCEKRKLYRISCKQFKLPQMSKVTTLTNFEGKVLSINTAAIAWLASTSFHHCGR